MMKPFSFLVVLMMLLQGLPSAVAQAAPSASASSEAAGPADQSVSVFKNIAVEFDPDRSEGEVVNGIIYRKSGQMIETEVELPELPKNLRDAQRIVAHVVVKPVMVGTPERGRPGDPWTRVGSVRILKNSADAAASQPARPRDGGDKAAATRPETAEPQVPRAADEVELMRFITPFGGEATFSQDLTSLAPLLNGKRTMRLYLTSYKKPAWTVSLKLEYSATAVGYRRPAWAVPVFLSDSVNADDDTLKAVIDVPWGLDRPRLRIVTSGHATDGVGGDEFISRSHVLSIDGREIGRWRPWVEEGGTLRVNNPWSGRSIFGGRERWSSDLDRSGWRPGQVVYPFLFPAPELTPGRHLIELKVEGIRARDQQGYGYWRISAIAVADEPWPPEDPASP